MLDLRAHEETILLDFLLGIRKVIVFVVVVVVAIVIFIVVFIFFFFFFFFVRLSIRALRVFLLLLHTLLLFFHVIFYPRRVLHCLQHLCKRTLPILFDAFLKQACKHCPSSRLRVRRRVLHAWLAKFIPRSRRHQPNRIRPTFDFIVRYAPIENVHQFQRMRWSHLRL